MSFSMILSRDNLRLLQLLVLVVLAVYFEKLIHNSFFQMNTLFFLREGRANYADKAT